LVEPQGAVSDLPLKAYQRALEPKRLVMIKGGHFATGSRPTSDPHEESPLSCFCSARSDLGKQFHLHEMGCRKHIAEPDRAPARRVWLPPHLLFALAKRALRWGHLRHVHHFVVMSLLATAVYYLAFATGTARLPSSIAGLLSGAIPLFTFICAWLFLSEEHINMTKAAGVATILHCLANEIYLYIWNF
jgi:EamA-like transporter family